ncbi:ADP-binding subunit dhaL [Listeria monocytogenes N53-1]|nr:ADP-binding subunit dhaL [Listeria monocytogenes N53-1]
MTYDKDWALRWLNDFGERVQENKQLLSDLDQAIGDGDHGINMARGLGELKKAFTEKEPADLKDDDNGQQSWWRIRSTLRNSISEYE